MKLIENFVENVEIPFLDEFSALTIKIRTFNIGCNFSVRNWVQNAAKVGVRLTYAKRRHIIR